jgi:hypothetical protein
MPDWHRVTLGVARQLKDRNVRGKAVGLARRAIEVEVAYDSVVSKVRDCIGDTVFFAIAFARDKQGRNFGNLAPD